MGLHLWGASFPPHSANSQLLPPLQTLSSEGLSRSSHSRLDHPSSHLLHGLKAQKGLTSEHKSWLLI